MSKIKFKRVLLKLSGEALLGERGVNIDPLTVQSICEQVKEVRDLGVEVAIVIGGGNIFRGLAATKNGIDRVTADQMGMLATVMNGLALQAAFKGMDVPTRVMSALGMEELAEGYIKRRAVRHLEKGRMVIFVAGTGNPFFTTDTAASLRAAEIEADVLIKGTRVEGIYSSDPEKNDDAVLYETLTFMDVLKNDLRVMDATAISLARENETPILVFNILKVGNLKRLIQGEKLGTLVTSEK